MKIALLVASLHAAGFGMVWEPFTNCTESHQVDSIQSLVWIDPSMISELAPYRGYAKLRYHPGTCFIARTEFKPSYLDTSFVVESSLSADRRRLDYRWIAPGPQEYLPQGTTWFSATGEVDSSLDHSYSQVEGQPPIRTSHRQVRRRSAQSLVITDSYRRGEAPWEVLEKDSVVVSGAVTTVYTVDEGGTYVTRCAAEGSTYVCTPTPLQGDVGDFQKQVWHLTGGRPDSLRTYLQDGRLESTDHWFWSSRVQVSVRRPFLRPRLRAGTESGRYNLLGRILSPSAAPRKFAFSPPLP